jgi:predicted nucleotidyltransferase
MKKLIDIKQIGKSKVITLGSNPLLKNYLAISSEEEKQEFIKKNPIITKISKEIEKDIVLLFGSYAKENATKSSDIDIMVINNDGSRSISFSKYETLFKIEINPIFITKKEFAEMLRNDEGNVGKEVLRNHMVLNGPDKLWEGVLDAK